MEKIKRLVIIASIIFLLGGVFLNSNFIEQKQDEAYAQLKEKYSQDEVPVTEIKEIKSTNCNTSNLFIWIYLREID